MRLYKNKALLLQFCKLSKFSYQLTFYVILGLFFASATLTNALNCYACSYLESYSNTSCLTNSSQVQPINCTKKYCVTVRQEAVHNSSKVISFLRDCTDKPLFLNDVKTDAAFRTYYRSCQQDFCNGHDGRAYNSSGSFGNGTGSHNSSSGNHNGIIPGKNGGFANKGHLLQAAAAILLTLMAAVCN